MTNAMRTSDRHSDSNPTQCELVGAAAESAAQSQSYGRVDADSEHRGMVGKVVRGPKTTTALSTTSQTQKYAHAQIPNALRAFAAHSDSNSTHSEPGDVTAESAALLQCAKRIGHVSDHQKVLFCTGGHKGSGY